MDSRNIKNCSGSNDGIKIIGFGNLLMSDDGIGIRVIEKLEKLDYFKNIELIDGGTSGIDLIFYLQNSDKVILIDAVDAGQRVAGIVTITYKNIKKLKSKEIKSFSLHDFNLHEVLLLANTMGLSKKLVIVGIKPKKIEFGECLSYEVESKIPDIIELIKKELEK